MTAILSREDELFGDILRQAAMWHDKSLIGISGIYWNIFSARPNG